MKTHQAIQFKSIWRFLPGLVFFMVAGCLAGLPDKVLKEADPSVSFDNLVRFTKSYKGKMVVLGGTIVSMKDVRSGSELAILQLPLDRHGMPKPGDRPGGIFLVRHNKSIDRSSFRKGQRITLAAKVIGRRIREKNQGKFSFPLLRLEEYQLWSEKDSVGGDVLNYGTSGTSGVFY
ncbi:MAG: Slp family lipoprotein [Nitrospinales bacterium]